MTEIRLPGGQKVTWKDFQQCARDESIDSASIETFWKEYQDMKTGENIYLQGDMFNPHIELSFQHRFMNLIDVEDLLACLGDMPPASLPEPDRKKIMQHYDKLWETETKLHPDTRWMKEEWVHWKAPDTFTLDQVKELSEHDSDYYVFLKKSFDYYDIALS